MQVDKNYPGSRSNIGEYTLRNSAVEYLTRKRLGKRARASFIFKVHPTDICGRNLSETDHLDFHVIEPRSHLAQLMG